MTVTLPNPSAPRLEGLDVCSDPPVRDAGGSIESSEGIGAPDWHRSSSAARHARLSGSARRVVQTSGGWHPDDIC